MSDGESFHDFFDMVPADTEALKHAAYRLRYRVYCLETGFENPDEFSNGMEIDEDDARAVHYLVRHRRTGLYAATTRLILPDPSDPDRLFPMERHSKLGTDNFLTKVPRNQIAEVSRFCVSPDFKRRRGERGTQAGVDGRDLCIPPVPSTVDRRNCPHIMVALIASVVRMTVCNRITHLYCFMEAPLVRLCNQLGIQFRPVGPISYYHGERLPSAIQVPEDLQPLRKKNRHLWNQLTDNGNFWAYNQTDGQCFYHSFCSGASSMQRQANQATPRE